MKAARPGTLIALILSAIVATACRSVTTPPDVVVDPLIAGHWVSEEVVASSWRITLLTGQQVDIDPAHMQLAIANTVARKEGTLILFGKGPRVDWYVVLNPADPADGYPVGCYPVGSPAYQVGDSIVLRARPDAAPSGQEADFGIRFGKAPDLDPPPARSAPWYGNSVTLCINFDGIVTKVAPPSGP